MSSTDFYIFMDESTVKINDPLFCPALEPPQGPLGVPRPHLYNRWTKSLYYCMIWLDKWQGWSGRLSARILSAGRIVLTGVNVSEKPGRLQNQHPGQRSSQPPCWCQHNHCASVQPRRDAGAAANRVVHWRNWYNYSTTPSSNLAWNFTQ